EFWRKGIGTKIVEVALSESRDLDVYKVFALTYQTGFFEKLGFKIVDKSVLPHKIWADCLKCIKFPDCDETAMMLNL
ncbi:MAG: GNAT family N-acetyltransferase, partial [Pseudomonadota bacterium]